MGRLLGGWSQVCWEGGSIPVWACRDVTGQGRNKAGTCSFSQPQPCMERGCPALGGLSRVRGRCFVGSRTTQRLAGRKDPPEHWGSLRHCSWQWFEDIAGRWKSLPQSLGHSWGWHTCVCAHVYGSTSSFGMLPPTQGWRGSQEQTYSVAQTIRGGADGTDVLWGRPDNCFQELFRRAERAAMPPQNPVNDFLESSAPSQEFSHP